MTFGQKLAALKPEQPVTTTKQALRAATPRHQRPTACLTCGGELPPDRPAYCSIQCAMEARR